MASSIFPEGMLGGALTVETIAAKLAFFHEQLHLLHWQTKSYAEHVALGGLYDKMVDFKDEIIEKIIGYSGMRPRAFRIEPIQDYSLGLSSRVVSDIITFATNLEKYADSNNMPDICNIAQGLSGEAAKVKYLLTLS